MVAFSRMFPALMLGWLAVGSAWADVRPFCNVRTAELTLEALGFSPGEADMRITAATRAAVKAFQGTVQLRRTGELNPPTCSEIMAHARTLGIGNESARANPVTRSRIPTWSEIPECEIYRTRYLNNQLLLSRTATRPLNPKTRRQHRSVETDVGRRDQLVGVGTYVQITGRGVELCGVRFDAGGFAVTNAGLRLFPGTRYTR